MKTRTLLERLSFAEDWDAFADELPAYFYDFGNLQLFAAQVANRHFRPVFMFSGVCSDSRSVNRINFELPLVVESFEQGAALIAHFLGSDFIPQIPTPWLDNGRNWIAYLPWEKEHAAYSARPQCSVEKEWFRVASRKLLELGEAAGESELVWLSFDGEVLRFQLHGRSVICPAIAGEAWPESYAISACELGHLPKRFSPLVSIGVWDGRLTIGNRGWTLQRSRHAD
ncbi:hypothetical protein D3C76_708300 [compost metagenome]